ncbi:hypothetical protein MKZ38_007827 [Zalerion maritima]|uniref:Uncharacterized protein n=1 Tax=Zalerion maritima TaxID=339359 RepID=A0AAD5RI71_9PEZI|nr:hypothetical protein MKZ38_007827 [Zalerion maritima]
MSSFATMSNTSIADSDDWTDLAIFTGSTAEGSTGVPGSISGSVTNSILLIKADLTMERISPLHNTVEYTSEIINTDYHQMSLVELHEKIAKLESENFELKMRIAAYETIVKNTESKKASWDSVERYQQVNPEAVAQAWASLHDLDLAKEKNEKHSALGGLWANPDGN